MSEPQRERLSPAWIALLALTVLWTLALLQWGQSLNWDEIEFFRATRWIAEGRAPFRDYWEHHLPLQWRLFAPMAALVSNGPGTQAIVALRWAQVPLWIITFAIVMALMRRMGIGLQARWAAFVLLLSSIWFTRAALQYRVDVPGHLTYLAALWVIVFRGAKWIPFAAGALFALAVLANMRLAPLVLITVALVMFWRPDEERWAWNPDGLRICAGGLAVALAFVAHLQLSGAMPGFVEGVIWYNRTSDRLLPSEARSFLMRLAGPIVQRDVGGAAFLIAAAVGLVPALRRIARPGLLGFVAILAVASLATIALLGVQYEYHFQTPSLLLMPLAAASIDRLRARHLLGVAALAAASLLLTIVAMAPDFGTALAYQDRVMREVDRRTEKTEKVWDSTGYALRREPAYRYWFLPAGVRLLADKGLIEPYDIEQIAADPPAAIIVNARTRWWMLGRPRLARYVLHHYVPLYQHLWLPGMSAAIGPEPSRTTWTVPRTGRYDIYVSELLIRHPWFARPLEYGVLEGTELAIPLDRLPPAPATELQWRVNDSAVAGTGTLDLQRGARLELSSSLRQRVGVLVVPHGVRMLSLMPDGPVPF